jgi:hypothetical protein
VVIDGYAGEIENLAPVNLAVLVEIDDTVEESRSTTALAQRFLRKWLAIQSSSIVSDEHRLHRLTMHLLEGRPLELPSHASKP